MKNRKNRILLVDDNEANRYALSRVLNRAGYEIIEASTGKEGMAHLAARPDLVILDVRLPDINGLEVSRRIRQDPKLRSIPILQVSATFTMTVDKIAGLDAGADGYLASPVEPDELLAHIRTLLRLKDAQDALGYSNERLRSVLSNIVEIYFALDFEWQFMELNPAAEKFFGRPAEDLIGKKIWTEFKQGDGQHFAKSYEEALTHRKPVHFEGESAIRPGTWWEGHCYPREDRLEVYLRDITERKLAEQKLVETTNELKVRVQELQKTQAELAQARDQLSMQNEILEARVRERTAKLEDTVNDLETFSYSITHDMRAPLRAMQGFSRMLLDEYANKLDAEGLDYLSRIAGSANRLDLLIRDVLSYSNVVRAKMVPVPVDLDQLVRSILAEYPGLQPPQANVITESPLPTVMGNEAFLTQVLSNLISNAAKFVPHGKKPEIRIKSQELDNWVRLLVIDNGIGIPRDHQAGLFRLFHRARNDYPGTGIGLAVVKKAVERMGGRVGLESEVGKGSTFWVDLPVKGDKQ